MSIWTSRGGRERLYSFSKRRWKNRTVPESPTTVLSPESSTESGSVSSSEEPIVLQCDLTNIGRSADIEVEAGCFEQVDNQTWTLSADKPSDLLIEVDTKTFHLHKLPILSRSGLLSRLATHSSDLEKVSIQLDFIPGGAEAFVLAAKFCYGVDVELSPTNVAALRCASEYLEMTEELEEGNVITKAEAYLKSVILNSWQESIIVLQSCELLLPWAEDLHILQRCSESVAQKACVDLENVRWLFSTCDSAVTNSMARPSASVPNDWWYEDTSYLTLYCFQKVITAMKQNGVNPAVLGSALEYYVQKWLPLLFKPSAELLPSLGSSRLGSPTGNISPDCEASLAKSDAGLRLSKEAGVLDSTSRLHDVIVEQNKNRYMLETIVSMMPLQKNSISCTFLLRMLRAANMFNCSAHCKADLEKQAGQQLDRATLSDLLIPSFSHTSEYLYDVDIVRRLLDHFLTFEQGLGPGLKSKSLSKKFLGTINEGSACKKLQPAPNARTKTVAKVFDSYLDEVARDSKLPLAKFQSLAEALPLFLRVVDDGLYRAIDTYLKTHQNLTEHERKKLCRILDCQRLSLDSCMHAAQNERLPLRTIVQVLFSEQLKLRSAINGISNSLQESCSTLHGFQSTSNDSELVRHKQEMLETTNRMEIRALQHELAAMRLKCIELEKQHFTMLDQMEKSSRPRRQWSSGWKRLTTLHLFHHPTSKGDLAATVSERARISNAQRWRNSIS